MRCRSPIRWCTDADHSLLVLTESRFRSPPASLGSCRPAPPQAEHWPALGPGAGANSAHSPSDSRPLDFPSCVFSSGYCGEKRTARRNHPPRTSQPTLTHAADLRPDHFYPSVPACRSSPAYCSSSLSSFLPPRSVMHNRLLFHRRHYVPPSARAARSRPFPAIASTTSPRTFTSRM